MRTSIIVSITAMILAPFFLTGLTGHKHYEDNMKNSIDSLAFYYKVLDLQADGDYQNILISIKHGNDRLAPIILRQFIERFTPKRMSLHQGVDNTDGMLSFWWFLNDYSINGKVDDFVRDCKVFMEGIEFKAEDSTASETGIISYTFEDEHFNYMFEFRDFQNYTGGPLCGGEIFLEISLKTNLPEPELDNILKLYPAINCYSLPTKIEKELHKKKFTSVSFGGTWDYYYTWDVQVKCLDDTEASMLKKQLTEFIMAAGYSFNEESGNTVIFIFREGSSPAYFQLSKEEDSNIVGVHFQPNS